MGKMDKKDGINWTNRIDKIEKKLVWTKNMHRRHGWAKIVENINRQAHRKNCR